MKSTRNNGKAAPTNDFKQKFEQQLLAYDNSHQASQKKPWTCERIMEIIQQLKISKGPVTGLARRAPMEYYWMTKYDIMATESQDYLIYKRKKPNEPTIRIIPREQYFDVLFEVHESCKHAGRDKMVAYIKNVFYIPKKAIEIFISLCPVCQTKVKRIMPKKSPVIRPIISNCLNVRGHVDLIDFQSTPDGEYKWLLIYHDNGTKYTNLRPMKAKRTNEIALELTKIFLMFGAPCLLEFPNGFEFIAGTVIEEIMAMWPGCKIDHSCCNSPTTEDHNQYIKNNILGWMSENNSSNWSFGSLFVQYQMNSSSHSDIGKSPYKALFGCRPNFSLASSVVQPSEFLDIKIEIQEVDSQDDMSENDDIPLQNLKDNNYSTCEMCHSKISRAGKCQSCTEADTDDKESLEPEIPKTETPPLIDCDSLLKKGINIKRIAKETQEMTKKPKKFPSVEIGICVYVNVPKEDRGPLDTQSIKAKTVEFKDGLYRVATKAGIIQSWFERPNLRVSFDDNEEDLEVTDTPISIREAVLSQSQFPEIEFQQCMCKALPGQCQNKRCQCYKKKVACSSMCHKNITCVNK